MTILISKEKNRAVYFNVTTMKKYDVELAHLVEPNGKASYDCNIVIAWETSYDSNGVEIEDFHTLHLLEYFFGETDNIGDAIKFCKGMQDRDKKYPFTF